MADRTKRFVSLGVTVALVGLNLLALNYLIAGWSTARVDMTSEGLYSITPATKRILRSLDEELTVYGYFSSRTHPKLAPLVPQIVDLLDEYRAVSGGKLHVEIVDPGGDEAVEQEAAERYGVQSTPFRLASKYESAIVNAYFALVIKYGDQYVRYGYDDLISVEVPPEGDIEVRLRNLEYDLTRGIKKVVYGFRGTNELFDRLDDPAKLTLIWTPDALPEVFAEIPEAVRTAVKEIAEVGGDKFSMEEIDPSKDKSLEQQVYERYGASPMSLGLFGDSQFYLYGLLEVGDAVEQIVLTNGSPTAASVREEIENALKRHTPGFLKTVGIVTPDPPEIPPEIRMRMQLPPQPPPEFEDLKSVLGEDYAVRQVHLDDEQGVPSEVDVLLVIKPSNLEQKAVYNLDQYLMRGGRVVICSGSYDVNLSQSLSLTPIESGLGDWLKHNGITVDQSLVLDDRNQQLPIPEIRQTPFGAMRTWTLAPYPYLVQVRDEGFLNPEVTSTLNSVGIYWGSPLQFDEQAAGDDAELIPILQSSDRSWTDTDLSQVALVDYEVPAEGTAPRLLAAAVNGRFKSYFPEGAPEQAKPAEPDAEGADAEADDKQVANVALKESPETRLVVIGDAVFLSDFVARALSQVEGGFFVQNLRFVQNVIDWVSLDNDMLGIRARGVTARRLERLSRPAEMVVEVLSYLIPIVTLLGLAAFLQLRRRQAAPVSAESGGPVAAGGVKRREV